MRGEVGQAEGAEVADNLDLAIGSLLPNNTIEQCDQVHPFVTGAADTTVIEVVAVNVHGSRSAHLDSYRARKNRLAAVFSTQAAWPT
ncbi:hypothetical protein D9M72_511660 [compost metagenome]